MTEWQPIDTAPEEEDILIANENGAVFYGIKRSNFFETSCDGLGCYCEPQIIENAAHWMPLPKPPKKKHDCKSKFYKCFRDSQGHLIVGYTACEQYNQYAFTVDYCPICGEKA